MMVGLLTFVTLGSLAACVAGFALTAWFTKALVT